MIIPSDGHIWPWFGSILTFQFEPNAWFQIRTRISIAISRMVLLPVQLIIHSKNPHPQSESTHGGLVFWSIVLVVRSNRWPRGFHHFPAIVDRPYQVFQHCWGHPRCDWLAQHRQNLRRLRDCRFVDNVMGLPLWHESLNPVAASHQSPGMRFANGSSTLPTKLKGPDRWNKFPGLRIGIQP